MKIFITLMALLTATTFSTVASADDFYICAKVNRDYVIGSKVVTLNGIFKRAADGSWEHQGYNDATLTAVAIDPRDRNVVYTSANNGLWRTLDGGKHWLICNDWDMTEARHVAIDPNAPDHVYLSLPDGIAVSTDRGATLVRRENGLPERGKYTQLVAIDRTKAGRVFAGCEVGIFLTEDGADSWRRVLPTVDIVNDIQQSPHDAKHWLTVTQSAGAWASYDGGLTWDQIKDVPTEHTLYNLTFDPTDVRRMAIASWGLGIVTSEDGGKTWLERNAGLPEPHRVWRVGVDPEGRLYASVFRETLYYSDDFGRTWQADAMAGSLVNYFLTIPKAEQ